MERNFVLETSCHRKIYSHRRKFPITGRYFLSNEEVSSHRKKFSVIGRYLLSQEEILSTGRHYLSEDEISYHRKKFLQYISLHFGSTPPHPWCAYVILKPKM